MDWIRRPYRSACQFNRDGGPVGEVQWYFAAADALPLDGASGIVSLDQECDKTINPQPIGEIWNDDRPYSAFRFAPGSGRGHVCGDAYEFLHGGHYDPLLPPVAYGTNGLPLCCGAALVSRGGVGAGGRGTVVPVVVLTSRGGVGAGGRGTVGYSDPPAGGVEVGGDVPGALAFVDAPAGGVEVGGDVPGALAFVDPPSGGVEIGGDVAGELAFVDPPSGGVEIGGDVAGVYTPGSVTPGTSCATAGTMTLGVSVPITTTAGGGALWLKFPVSNGTLYHVRVSSFVTGGSITVDAGVDCSSHSLQFLLFGDGCNTFTAAADGFGFLIMTPDFFSSGSYTVIADTGAC